MISQVSIIQDLNLVSEILCLDDYVYYNYQRSRIDPEKIIRAEMRLICPRCRNEQKCPPYGEKESCSSCGLVMYIHGSELICYFNDHSGASSIK